MSSVGFIGLGSMGSALASRLLERAEVVVYDLDPGHSLALEEMGAIVADTPAAVANRCQTVITCLPMSGHVREVIFSRDGLAASLREGALIIDCTSGDPAETQAIAAELEPRGIALVDSPVSGGPQAAKAGTIALMVGGSEQNFARAAATLSQISPNIRHVGGVGAGHCVKLLNNVLAAGHRMLAFETAAIAAANGVDPQIFIDVVNISSGRSYATEVTMPRHVFGERLVQGFSLGLMAKDVHLGATLIDADVRRTSLTEQIDSRLQALLPTMGAAADINETLAAYEASFGVSIATSER